MAGCMTRKIGGRRYLRNTHGRFKPKQPRNYKGRYTFRATRKDSKGRKGTSRADRR